MNKRRLTASVALLAVVVVAIALWKTKPWAPDVDTGLVIASGTVDATEVSISFRVPGILRKRSVDEGSVIKAGDILAELDTAEAHARLRQAQAAEQAAWARLKDLEQGYRPQEIAEASAQVQLALANLVNLQEEAKRSEILFATGAVSRQRRDKDETAASVAQQQHRAAQERLKLLQSGFRKETVAAARAQVAEAQAAVEVARVALKDLQVKSTINGTVTRKHAEPGETLAAARPVLTVTDLSRPWVRVYIPENQIGRVRLGAPAKIKIDTFPDREFTGRVTYVSSQAEFTPKNVQTQEERVKLVFAVNVTADNPEGILKPGMPADAYIQADSARAP
jgi:HlyD family secretion protein